MGNCLVRRTDLDATELCQLAATNDSDRQRRRLVAIAALLDGASRSEAAAVGRMSWQTLRDWVRRYNAKGVGGLRSRRGPWTASKLTAGQRAEFARLVAAGPQPDAQMRRGWRRCELVALCWDHFGVRYSERSVSRLLHRLGLAHLSIRAPHARRRGQADRRLPTAFKGGQPSPTMP